MENFDLVKKSAGWIGLLMDCTTWHNPWVVLLILSCALLRSLSCWLGCAEGCSGFPACLWGCLCDTEILGLDVSISPWSSFLVVFTSVVSRWYLCLDSWGPGFLIQSRGWQGSKAKCVPAQCLSVAMRFQGASWDLWNARDFPGAAPSSHRTRNAEVLLIQFTNHNTFFMTAECCANEWCQCEAEVICFLVQGQQGWELSKPTCIYSNPTIRGIPFKCKIYWPTNSLPGSVACQPKCCLNYSENNMCVEDGGAHSQLRASSSCNGVVFPSSEIPWNVCFDQ